MKNKKELYKKKIMKYFKSFAYRGNIENATFSTGKKISSCGVKISFEVVCGNNEISEIKFQGDGSILSEAAASILCEYAKDKTFEEILEIDKKKLLELLGVELGPTRLKSVFFILNTLKDGIKSYVESRKSS